MTYKTTEALKLAEEAQTPLKDLLRAVPKDGSDLYEEDKFCHHNIPYGRLIHEALAEIERLEALAEPVKQEPVKMMNAAGNTEAYLPEQQTAGFNIPLYAAPVGAEHFLKAIASLREAIEVCRAEALEEHSMFLDDPHPPHRCCECAECLEYFKGQSCDDYAHPVKQEPVAVISESAIGLVKLHSNGVSLPFGTPLYTAPVQPVKQEPVAWWDGTKNFVPFSSAPLEAAVLAEREACADLMLNLDLCGQEGKAAAAIRAEALEEAAKVCDAVYAIFENPLNKSKDCAAAIRGLK